MLSRSKTNARSRKENKECSLIKIWENLKNRKSLVTDLHLTIFFGLASLIILNFEVNQTRVFTKLLSKIKHVTEDRDRVTLINAFELYKIWFLHLDMRNVWRVVGISFRNQNRINQVMLWNLSNDFFPLFFIQPSTKN